jgi:hypothetical protein
MPVGYYIRNGYLYDTNHRLYWGGSILFPEGHPYHGVRHDEFKVNGKWGWTFSHRRDDTCKIGAGTWEIGFFVYGFIVYPDDPESVNSSAIKTELTRVAHYIMLNEPMPVQLNEPMPVQLNEPIPVQLNEPIPVQRNEPIPVQPSRRGWHLGNWFRNLFRCLPQSSSIRINC